MELSLLAALNAERHARRAVILVTEIASGAQLLVKPEAIAADPLGQALERQLRAGKSGMVEVEGRSYFLTVQAPHPRIVVTGAVHISQAMAPMARALELDLVIIDPRTAFATPGRFPETALLAEWPEEAIGTIGLDGYTAFVALTHDPKIDDPGLTAALAFGLLLYRRARQPEDPRQAAGTPRGGRFRRDGGRPHPRADRPRHRRRLAGRDRARHSRRDRRRTARSAPPTRLRPRP